MNARARNPHPKTATHPGLGGVAGSADPVAKARRRRSVHGPLHKSSRPWSPAFRLVGLQVWIGPKGRCARQDLCTRNSGRAALLPVWTHLLHPMGALPVICWPLYPKSPPAGSFRHGDWPGFTFDIGWRAALYGINICLVHTHSLVSDEALPNTYINTTPPTSSYVRSPDHRLVVLRYRLLRPRTAALYGITVGLVQSSLQCFHPSCLRLFRVRTKRQASGVTALPVSRALSW